MNTTASGTPMYTASASEIRVMTACELDTIRMFAPRYSAFVVALAVSELERRSAAAYAARMA